MLLPGSMAATSALLLRARAQSQLTDGHHLAMLRTTWSTSPILPLPVVKVSQVDLITWVSTYLYYGFLFNTYKYLGRPWTEYARVVFQYTTMSNVINSAGWEKWSSSSPNTADVLFGEYDNSGAGSQGTRASFATKLSSPIAITTILGSDYANWVDTSYLS